MQLARNERLGLGEALGYARRKLFDYIIGPAIPLIVFALLAFLNALGTFILTIFPYLGSVLTAHPAAFADSVRLGHGRDAGRLHWLAAVLCHHQC